MSKHPAVQPPPSTKCKCGADIFFVTSVKSGKTSPLNASRRLFATLEQTPLGEVVAKEWRQGYESHFATCPNRDEFRRDDDADSPNG